MNWTDWLPPLAVSYLLGSVPFSYWIGRARGVDIRRVGSGNVGATNVFRAVGRSWGALALVCDMTKGVLAASLIPALWLPSVSRTSSLACGFAAIAGHTWPIALRFQGGKGVATGAGVLFMALPPIAAVGLGAWLAGFVVFRRVSMASILAALTAAAVSWPLYFARTPAIPAALSAIALLVVWRHRSNLVRIRNGTEPRVPLGRRGRSAE